VIGDGGGVRDDRGVSPVVATILPVAIAVTLAAAPGWLGVDPVWNSSSDGPDAAISLELDQRNTGGFARNDSPDGESVVVSREGGTPVDRSSHAVLVNATPVPTIPSLTHDPVLPEELTAETRVNIVPTGPGTNDLVPGTEIRVDYENFSRS
jgi:flagellin-like protein